MARAVKKVWINQAESEIREVLLLSLIIKSKRYYHHRISNDITHPTSIIHYYTVLVYIEWTELEGNGLRKLLTVSKIKNIISLQTPHTQERKLWFSIGDIQNNNNTKK